MQPISAVRSAVRAPAEGAESEGIPTRWGICYVGCGILAEGKNGVVVGLKGNPDSPQNRGAMCAKGKAAAMNLYNPNRVKVPLKRTNPRKGLHEDPQWLEISWDEAIDAIVAALDRIRDNPKKLLVQGWESVGDTVYWLKGLSAAFGTPHFSNNGSPTCGKVIHPVEYFSGGGFHQHTAL